MIGWRSRLCFNHTMLYMDLAALWLQTPGLEWEWVYGAAASHLRLFLRTFPTKTGAHLTAEPCQALSSDG